MKKKQKLSKIGGVKMKLLKISVLVFLTIQLDSAYQKTYTWVKIWLKSAAHSLKKLTLKFSTYLACRQSRGPHISKTVKFRTLVLLRHLFLVIKPTIINGQNVWLAKRVRDNINTTIFYLSRYFNRYTVAVNLKISR